MTGFYAAATSTGYGRRTRPRDLLDRAGSILAMAVLVGAAAVWQQQSETGDVPDGDARAGAAAPRAVPPGSEIARETMFGAYGGMPYIHPSDVNLRKSASQDFIAHDVDWRGEPFKSPIYYGARIIRWFGNARTGAMLDFTHSKAIADLKRDTTFSGTLDGAPAPAKAVLGDIYRRLEFSHGHNTLMLNGMLRLPSFIPHLAPYVGAGAGVSLPHSEMQIKDGAARTYEYQYAGPSAQALFGIELRFGRMSYFVEYKFTFARYEAPLTHRDGVVLVVDLWRQLQRWLSGEAPPGGFVTTLLASHQVIAGLGVRTASAPAAAGP